MLHAMTRARVSHTGMDGEYDLVGVEEHWPVQGDQTWILRGDDGAEVRLEH